MDSIYVTMNSAMEQVSLLKEMCLEHTTCSLLELGGRFFPYTDETLFLCVDFVRPSPVEGRMLPVVRKLKVVPDKKREEGLLRDNFRHIVYVPTNRSLVKEFRVFISDEKGNIPSFDYCHLKCTLVIECC